MLLLLLWPRSHQNWCHFFFWHNNNHSNNIKNITTNANSLTIILLRFSSKHAHSICKIVIWFSCTYTMIFSFVARLKTPLNNTFTTAHKIFTFIYTQNYEQINWNLFSFSKFPSEIDVFVFVFMFGICFWNSMVFFFSLHPFVWDCFFFQFSLYVFVVVCTTHDDRVN